MMDLAGHLAARIRKKISEVNRGINDGQRSK